MSFPPFPTLGTDAPTGSNGPAFPVDIDRQPKVLTASFGDNYTQDVVDGINGANLTDVTVTFNLVTNDDRATVEGFLSALGGAGRFTYTPPGTTTQMTFVCPKWSWHYVSYNNWTLNATFTRKFDAA